MKKTILMLLLAVSAISTVGCGAAASKAAPGGYMDSGYSKAELNEMGVNTEHLFVLTEERAAYNGRSFSIKHPVDSLIATFGPDYRILPGDEYNDGYSHYFWDEIGFVALVSPEKEVLEWNLHWDYLPKTQEYDYDNPDPAFVPKKFFQGKILLNGFPLDNTSDYAAYCNDQALQNKLIEMAEERGIKKNFHKVLYHCVETGDVRRYETYWHKLYFFDYTPFDEDTFFSYRVKITTKTRRIHEFGMQYDVYTNPNFTDIF